MAPTYLRLSVFCIVTYYSGRVVGFVFVLVLFFLNYSSHMENKKKGGSL